MKIKKHSASLAVATAWFGGLIALSQRRPDVHEAISQYANYDETKYIFGFTVMIASLFLGLFADILSRHWAPAKLLIKVAALCFIITAWTPYGWSTAPEILHVSSFMVGVFCVSLSLWRATIEHHPKLSHALMFAVTISAITALGAALTKQWSFHLELSMLVIAQSWCVFLAYKTEASQLLPSVSKAKLG